MRSVSECKEHLDIAIEYVVENKDKYVASPGKDFSRNRVLDMRQTLETMLSMHGGSLNKEIYEINQYRGITFSKSAYCQRRSKLNNEAMKAVFDKFNNLSDDNKTYRGYRLFAVDGTDINIFRNPTSESYIVPSGHKRGYNLLHMNAIYDITNKTYLDAEIQTRSTWDERDAFYKMLRRKKTTDKCLFVFDRGYESYNFIAHLLNAEKVDFVLRGRLTSSFKPIKTFPEGEFDEDISMEITTTQTKEDKRKNRIFLQAGTNKNRKYSTNTKITRWDFSSPYKLKFRAVKIMLDNGSYELLYTSLSRELFSLDDLRDIYRMRWGIETSFRELKHTVGVAYLHTRREELVSQEIYAALIMYNFFQRISILAVILKQKKNVYQYKINYTMAYMICKTAYKRGRVSEEILTEIAKYTLPVRLGRSYARNISVKSFVGFVYRTAA